MRRFRYRLERVLQFRKLIEAEAKRELQQAQRVLNDAESVFQQLEQELVKDFGAGGTASVVRVEEFLLANTYRAGLRIRIATQHETIVAHREVVAEKMMTYRSAARELESLERHRKGKVTEHEYEVSAAEQAQIDELMTQRNGRH